MKYNNHKSIGYFGLGMRIKANKKNLKKNWQFQQATGAVRHITPGPPGVALIFQAHPRDHQRISGNGRTTATLAVRINLTAALTWDEECSPPPSLRVQLHLKLSIE